MATTPAKKKAPIKPEPKEVPIHWGTLRSRLHRQITVSTVWNQLRTWIKDNPAGYISSGLLRFLAAEFEKEMRKARIKPKYAKLLGLDVEDLFRIVDAVYPIPVIEPDQEKKKGLREALLRAENESESDSPESLIERDRAITDTYIGLMTQADPAVIRSIMPPEDSRSASEAAGWPSHFSDRWIPVAHVDVETMTPRIPRIVGWTRVRSPVYLPFTAHRIECSDFDDSLLQDAFDQADQQPLMIPIIDTGFVPLAFTMQIGGAKVGSRSHGTMKLGGSNASSFLARTPHYVTDLLCEKLLPGATGSEALGPLWRMDISAARDDEGDDSEDDSEEDQGNALSEGTQELYDLGFYARVPGFTLWENKQAWIGPHAIYTNSLPVESFDFGEALCFTKTAEAVHNLWWQVQNLQSNSQSLTMEHIKVPVIEGWANGSGSQLVRDIIARDLVSSLRPAVVGSYADALKRRFHASTSGSSTSELRKLWAWTRVDSATGELVLQEEPFDEAREQILKLLLSNYPGHEEVADLLKHNESFRSLCKVILVETEKGVKNARLQVSQGLDREEYSEPEEPADPEAFLEDIRSGESPDFFPIIRKEPGVSLSATGRALHQIAKTLWTCDMLTGLLANEWAPGYPYTSCLLNLKATEELSAVFREAGVNMETARYLPQNASIITLPWDEALKLKGKNFFTTAPVALVPEDKKAPQPDKTPEELWKERNEADSYKPASTSLRSKAISDAIRALDISSQNVMEAQVRVARVQAEFLERTNSLKEAVTSEQATARSLFAGVLDPLPPGVQYAWTSGAGAHFITAPSAWSPAEISALGSHYDTDDVLYRTLESLNESSVLLDARRLVDPAKLEELRKHQSTSFSFEELLTKISAMTWTVYKKTLEKEIKAIINKNPDAPLFYFPPREITLSVKGDSHVRNLADHIDQRGAALASYVVPHQFRAGASQVCTGSYDLDWFQFLRNNLSMKRKLQQTLSFVHAVSDATGFGGVRNVNFSFPLRYLMNKGAVRSQRSYASRQADHPEGKYVRLHENDDLDYWLTLVGRTKAPSDSDYIPRPVLNSLAGMQVPEDSVWAALSMPEQVPEVVERANREIDALIKKCQDLKKEKAKVAKATRDLKKTKEVASVDVASSDDEDGGDDDEDSPRSVRRSRVQRLCLHVEEENEEEDEAGELVPEEENPYS